MPIFKEEKVKVKIPFAGFHEGSCHQKFMGKALNREQKSYPAFQHDGAFQMMEGATKEVEDLLIGGVFIKGRVATQYRHGDSAPSVGRLTSGFCQEYGETFFNYVRKLMSITLYGIPDAINIKDVEYVEMEDYDLVVMLPLDLLRAILRETVKSSAHQYMIDRVKRVYGEDEIESDYSQWGAIEEWNSTQWREVVLVLLMIHGLRYWEEAISYSMFLKNEIPIEKLS